jgi:hypothetical protein
MDAKLQKVWVEDLELSDVEGKVVVRDGKLDMQHLHMGLLGGEMTMSGSYVAQSTETADVDIDVEMLRLELGQDGHDVRDAPEDRPGRPRGPGTIRFELPDEDEAEQRSVARLRLPREQGKHPHDRVALTPDFLGKVAEAVKTGNVDKLDLRDTTLRYNIKDTNAEVQPFSLKVGDAAGDVRREGGAS